MKIYSIVLSLVCVCLSRVAIAADFICPEKIVTEQSLLAPSSSDWMPLTDIWNGNQSFDHITVFDGHPKNGLLIAPDNVDKTDEISFWTIQKGADIWVGCFYQHSSLMLTKNIPAKTKKCTLNNIKAATGLICK